MIHFVGWIRAVPRGHWRPVVSAETRDDCWRLLLKVGPTAGGHDERMVCEAGRHPNGQATGPGH